MDLWTGGSSKEQGTGKQAYKSMAADPTSLLAFLRAASLTYQVLFDSEVGGAASPGSTFAEFEDALPERWSVDKAHTRASLTLLRALHNDPEPPANAVFHVLRRPLFPALTACGEVETVAAAELGEWLQLPMPLMRRLELHRDALRLRVAPPTGTSDAAIKAALPAALHARWRGQLGAMQSLWSDLSSDFNGVQRLEAAAAFNASLLGLSLRSHADASLQQLCL
jgi:hypothetical protein